MDLEFCVTVFHPNPGLIDSIPSGWRCLNAETSMRKHARPCGEGNRNESPAENGMDAAPNVSEHVLFLRLPDLGVVKFDDGQVNVDAVPERAVGALREFRV